MKQALIGFSGFVGTTLKSQYKFNEFFRSSNIEEITNRDFDLCVCAGAPAKKWLANAYPKEDLLNIKRLISCLKTVRSKTFILISTVDVFPHPNKVDESTPINEDGIHAYGFNRRYLEKFIEINFSHHLIVRLPALVGSGLKKNIVFDFLNKNNLDCIDSRAKFQFYPMENLWSDIQKALKGGLSLVHLTAEPVSVADVAKQAFGIFFNQTLKNPPLSYDMQTRFGKIFNTSGKYQYSSQQSIQAIKTYARNEPREKNRN